MSHAPPPLHETRLVRYWLGKQRYEASYPFESRIDRINAGRRRATEGTYNRSRG